MKAAIETTGLVVAILIFAAIVWAIFVGESQATAMQQPPDRLEFKVVGGWLLMETEHRILWCRKNSIVATAVYDKDPLPNIDHPTLYIQVGAQEFRVDCQTRQQALDISNLIRSN